MLKESSFRPTQERVRESVASILQPYIDNAIVLDLCAGSGAFGIELYSRGAQRIDLVENEAFRVKQLHKIVEEFKLENDCHIYKADAFQFVEKCIQKYDIIYFDPPYADEKFLMLIQPLRGLLTPDGVLVYEHHKGYHKNVSNEQSMKEGLRDTRVYGETQVDFFDSTNLNISH